MEFFKPGRTFDFMKARIFWIPFSFFLVIASTVLAYYPGPNYGTDFRGGTEIEVAFQKPVDAQQLRHAVHAAGFSEPDVVSVKDDKNPYRFLIRVQEISVVEEALKDKLRAALCYGVEPKEGTSCPPNAAATEVKFSAGGDKINARYEVKPDLKRIREQVQAIPGVKLRPSRAPQEECDADRAQEKSKCNPRIVNEHDNHVEVQLQSKGDQLMDGLRSQLGDAVPDSALRVEWVGPKAGKQLRDSARNSVAIAIVFIMLYLAFRFDLRFAPGVIIACIHDAMVVIGAFVLLRREVTLSTIAAILTIVGYSMNDTVVVYDRIRENLSRHRGKTFAQIINISVSETLSRTILTSGATMLSVLPFLFWGTGAIKDFALAMVIGIVAGTYSSIYVAAPLTEWIDRKMAKRSDLKKRLSGRAAVASGRRRPSTRLRVRAIGERPSGSESQISEISPESFEKLPS
jgi:preprotein translocase subunit SecF